jgi:hypothetical protein
VAVKESDKPAKEADKPAIVSASKFEQEFIDIDDEDEETPRPPSNSATQLDTKNMSAQEVLDHSISLVTKHLSAANAHVKKIEDSIKELQALVDTQKGVMKKELTKVIKKKTIHLTELKAHVSEGNAMLESKQKMLKDIKAKEVKKEDEID